MTTWLEEARSCTTSPRLDRSLVAGASRNVHIRSLLAGDAGTSCAVDGQSFSLPVTQEL